MPGHILVIGGGIFGLTAALELRRRGHRVTIADVGAIPSPLAASTDVSKVVRADYGSDVLYTELMEHARRGLCRPIRSSIGRARPCALTARLR